MQQELEQLRTRSFKERFIGNKAFYHSALAIVLPIMIQNGISTFVNLLDNIMVGMIGTEQMTGVSVANNLFFVFGLALFGGMSGVGIFTVQYCGGNDVEGIRKTVRYKMWLGVVLTIVTVCVLLLFSPRLIMLYLHDESGTGNIADTLSYGLAYVKIILLSLPAFMVAQVYSSTLRECSETNLPMKAGIVAVLTNLTLNYLLIFGKLGLPALGVNGAAIATVISRYVEAGIVVVWSHRHTEKQPWAKKLYLSITVPFSEVKKFFLKGTPLLANEILWSLAIVFMNQCYSLRGLEVVASLNISGNVTQFTSIIFTSMGSAVGIIIGQLLGAGKMIEAKDKDNKLVFFSILLSAVSMALLFVMAPLFPKIYNTSDTVKSLATSFMLVTCAFCPVQSFCNACYFTLRSGGKTIITFIFDCMGIWILEVPTAYLLCYFTSLPIITVYICVNLTSLVKCITGYIMLRKNIWIQNIVSE